MRCAERQKETPRCWCTAGEEQFSISNPGTGARLRSESGRSDCRALFSTTTELVRAKQASCFYNSAMNLNRRNGLHSRTVRESPGCTRAILPLFVQCAQGWKNLRDRSGTGQPAEGEHGCGTGQPAE